MATANFDASAILSASFQGANATKLEPLPEGEGYVGQITKVDVKTGSNKQGDPWIRLELTTEVTNDARLEAIGMEKKNVRLDCLLDVNKQTGTLDMGPGKNVGLGRYREAVKLNDPDQLFNLGMFVGQVIKFDMTHEVDPKDPEIVYERPRNFRSIDKD